MRSALSARPEPRAALLVAWILLIGSGCGGNGGTDVVLPSLSIRTTTAGVELDPDGYSVAVDGQAPQPIGLEATLTIDQLPAGQHSVQLLDLAPNCSVQGANPQTVSVAGGATTTTTFTVICSAASAAGAVRVATSTGGTGTDPDGYTLLLDAADRGPIGLNGSSTLGGIQAGAHAVGLTGLAANCQVTGENPRSVSVTGGATVDVAFVVTCAAPGPTTGTLEIAVSTTGADQDADGYEVSVDDGASQPIGTNATVTLANVSAVQHTIRLIGLAANCAVTGDNPLGAAVPAGGTVRVSFTVSCVATTGRLVVTVSGLPEGIAAAVTIAGPSGYSQGVTSTTTLDGLVPGTYTVSASSVVDGSTTYTPSIARPSVDVAPGSDAAATVSYTAEANITLNLRIDGLYITQSSQTYSSSVPLVAGRAAYLRVFVVANESNRARPSVRVRLSRPGASTRTLTLSAPGSSTPTQVQEGTLTSSWNLPLEAALIQPGLSIVAEVDPGDDIKETDEDDNLFPASGSKALAVQTVPAARLRFVSVQQGSSPAGNVTDGNKNQLTELTRRMHPLNAIDADVHSTVFTASAPLERDGTGWNQLLSDLDALRVAEGSTRTYYGVVNLPYGRLDGLVGLAFQGVPTAVGWDDAGDAGRVVAHELGHTWNQLHTPCGNPPGVDTRYPHGNGIGVYGFDVTARSLKRPSLPDIMGYCPSPWISDYTYESVLAFRAASGLRAGVAALPQPSVLIWGRIENGRAVLEPAVQLVTRPSLPSRPGPYSVVGTTAQGSQLFALSFDATATADDPRGGRHFAFAVPLDAASASRLATIRLVAGGSVTATPAAAGMDGSAALGSIVARREGASVMLRWNAAAHPLIMVRDADSGEVLSFARGGAARVWTSKGVLDLDVSDGARSYRLRLAISRP